MRVFDSIRALLATTRLTTRYPCVVAFTVLLLALALLAIAPLPLTPRQSTLHPHPFASLCQSIVVMVVVGAPDACAVFGTGFARRKALTVHLETLCLFASASRFFLFIGRSRSNSVALNRFHLLDK